MKPKAKIKTELPAPKHIGEAYTDFEKKVSKDGKTCSIMVYPKGSPDR